MKLKRTIAGILSALLVTSSISALAANDNVVVGDLLATDIKTYINGCAIQSYNVNGYTTIVAEDLVRYGFSVVWNDTARTVTIKRNDNTEFSGTLFDNSEKVQVGKKIGNAYFTDIKTFVNGITVLSYNIGGKTAIFVDALNLFGKVTYDDSKRALECTIDGLTYKKPLVTITDPDEIEVQTPAPTDSVAEFYSNGVVPNYEYVTKAKHIKTEDKKNNYVSYTYDNYNDFAVDTYVTHLVDKAGFTFNKVDQTETELTYFYTKGSSVALAIEVNLENKTVTLTFKK